MKKKRRSLLSMENEDLNASSFLFWKLLRLNLASKALLGCRVPYVSSIWKLSILSSCYILLLYTRLGVCSPFPRANKRRRIDRESQIWRKWQVCRAEEEKLSFINSEMFFSFSHCLPRMSLTRSFRYVSAERVLAPSTGVIPQPLWRINAS